MKCICRVPAVLFAAAFITMFFDAAALRSAPPPQDAELTAASTIKLNVDTVFLDVAVRDAATNRTVTGLRKEDFLVYEDGVGQEVQQLLPSAAPFQLLLLLDVSGSTAAHLKLMKKAAIKFTREIKSNDRIAVATFNWRVNLVQDFTGDRDAAVRAISGIRSGGGTAFYDALLTCLKDHMSRVEGRKAVVVFTDGIDNQLFGDTGEGSLANYDQLRHKVEEDRSIIYTIFLDTRGQIPLSFGQVPIFPGSVTRPAQFPRWLSVPPTVQQDAEKSEREAYETACRQLEEIASKTGGGGCIRLPKPKT